MGIAVAQPLVVAGVSTGVCATHMGWRYILVEWHFVARRLRSGPEKKARVSTEKLIDAGFSDDILRAAIRPIAPCVSIRRVVGSTDTV